MLDPYRLSMVREEAVGPYTVLQILPPVRLCKSCINIPGVTSSLTGQIKVLT